MAEDDFRERLDSDPDGAFQDFYELTWRLLKSSPPSAMRRLTSDQREEVISSVIVHCWNRNQRVLRMYEDRGSSFRYWLLKVANNQAKNYLAQVSRWKEVPLPPERDWGISPHDHAFRQFRGAVDRCLAKASQKCQMLLALHFDGVKPRDMSRLMGLPSYSNVQAANDLRYCRTKLQECLAAEGVDLSGLSGA